MEKVNRRKSNMIRYGMATLSTILLTSMVGGCLQSRKNDNLITEIQYEDRIDSLSYINDNTNDLSEIIFLTKTVKKHLSNKYNDEEIIAKCKNIDNNDEYSIDELNILIQNIDKLSEESKFEIYEYLNKTIYNNVLLNQYEIIDSFEENTRYIIEGDNYNKLSNDNDYFYINYLKTILQKNKGDKMYEESVYEIMHEFKIDISKASKVYEIALHALDFDKQIDNLIKKKYLDDFELDSLDTDIYILDENTEEAIKTLDENYKSKARKK